MRNNLSNREYLDRFSDQEIFYACRRDEYALDLLEEEIRRLVDNNDFDTDVIQILSDMNDQEMLINAYVDLFSEQEAVWLMMDSGKLNVVVSAVSDYFEEQ